MRQQMKLYKDTDSEILRYALEYFTDYIQYETTSDPKSPSCPSSDKIWDLAKKIKVDLEDLGLEVKLDNHCYIYSSLPGNRPSQHKIGLIAHMDTSPDMSGKDVKARRLTYEGQPVILNQDHPDYLADKEPAISLDQELFPNLAKYEGQEIIVTDGHSLLGADDKAGVAEIMALAKYLTKHPEIEHGDIQVAFTPDEEIGRGADLFDVAGFGADFAYTVDGSVLGEIEWENFNAASALVEVNGLSVHPGSAKGKLRNAMTLAAHYILAMPADETPEKTEGYEGFYHLTDMSGSVEEARLEYIIRDFDQDNFARRKKFMANLVDQFNQEFSGQEIFKLTIKDSYYNMRAKVEPYRFLIAYAKEAMAEAGIEAKEHAIRGGTDGSRLSYMGLPCPNLFTGGENFHGKYEFLSVETMQKALETLVNLVQKFVEPQD